MPYRLTFISKNIIFVSHVNPKEMKNIIISLFVFLVIFNSTFSQGWERTYGGPGDEAGNSVQQTTDGGYIIAGYTTSYGAGGVDVYIVKTDSFGDTLWTKTYGGTGDDEAFAVKQTYEGGYIISGYTKSYGNDKVYVIKTDNNGNSEWIKTYPGDAGNDIVQDFDSNYVIVGYKGKLFGGGADILLIKTNINGDTIWTKTYGDTCTESVNQIKICSDSSYILLGWKNYDYSMSKTHVYLLKVNCQGDTLWTRIYHNLYAWEGRSLQQTIDSGYILLCHQVSGYVGLINTDKVGNFSAFNSYLIPGCAYSIDKTADSNYIFTGAIGVYILMEEEVYLTKVRENGDTIWTRTFGGPGYEGGYSVQLTADNGFIVAGFTESFGSGGRDIYLINVNENGLITSNKESNTSHLGIKIFPNPNIGRFTICLNNIIDENINLRIYNIEGKCLYAEDFFANNPNKVIDITGYPKGIYFVKLISDDTMLHSKIIIY